MAGLDPAILFALRKGMPRSNRGKVKEDEIVVETL
jgi:hypothetical protein